MDQCSKTASSLCKEPTFNCYPSFMNVQLAYIDVPTCEKNIVLKLKNAMKYKSYWCNINSNNKDGLCKLLGLEYDSYEKIMHSINVFSTFSNKLIPKKTCLRVGFRGII